MTDSRRRRSRTKLLVVPQNRARDPVDVVRRLGGHAKARDVLPWTTRHRLWRAVQQGRVVHPARGVYVLPDLPEPEVTAARLGGRLSHASAAQWWGLALVRPPDAVDVVVVHGNRRAATPGVRLHRSRSLLDTPEIATDVLRTVLDCATVMPFPEALAIADSALAERYLRADRLVEAAHGTKGPGRARRMRVAQAADWRAANAFESCLRGVVLDAGLTGFEPQLEIRLPRRVVHVDVGDPRRRVALEADSFAHHGSRSDLVRDCERYDDLACEGWKVLRFTWEHVMFEQPWVAEVVEMTCRQRGGGAFVTSRRDVVPRPRAGDD